MKLSFLESIFFTFATMLCFVEANRGWGGGGGGGHGNRWKQGGGGGGNSWHQQGYHNKYGHNFGHNNWGNSNNNNHNYFGGGIGPYNNFNNQNDGGSTSEVTEELTPPQPQPKEDPLVSFAHRPSQNGCVKPSMGGSSMFELRCIYPDTGEDNDCVVRGGILSEGTTAILKCKAPYYNEKGDARIWVCEEGHWKGEFKTFSCTFTPTTTTTIIKNPSFIKNITNTNPTFTNNNNQKPLINNNGNKFNQTQNSNFNKDNQKPPVDNNNKYNHNNNNYKPPYNNWNTQNTSNEKIVAPPPNPKVTEKPQVFDSLFPDLVDDDKQAEQDWYTSLQPVVVPEAPKVVEQPSWQSGGWTPSSGGWSPPTTTTTTTTTKPTTTTTTTTSRPDVLPPSSGGGDDLNTLYTQYSQNTSQTQTKKCPSLSKRTGVQLECLSKTSVPWDPASFLISQTDCKTPQVVGTEATYKCQQYFEASAGLTIQYRKCKEDGTWTGGENNGFSCSLECGRANPVGKIPLITSGEPTYKAQWPWHTALFYRDIREDPTQHAFICGGTLVSRRAILTAAHCVTEYFSTSLKSLTEFRVDLGRYERTIEDEFVQTFSAETIIPHPSYNPYIFDSDIAIIILKSTVTVGFHVRPICYPQTQNSAFEDLSLSDGSVGTVVGFGKNENDKLSDILHMARLKVINQQECAESFADTASGSTLTKSTTFCAGLKNGTNVCSGDSGGGIYFPINTGSSSRWYLQGLVSVGIGSQDGSKKCDPTRHSIFTRISPYADWIVRILSEYDAL